MPFKRLQARGIPLLRPFKKIGLAGMRRWVPRRFLWGEAGAPGGTVRRAAVRKRGSGDQSRSEHRLPDLTRSNRGQIWRDLE